MASFFISKSSNMAAHYTLVAFVLDSVLSESNLTASFHSIAVTNCFRRYRLIFKPFRESVIWITFLVCQHGLRDLSKAPRQEKRL